MCPNSLFGIGLGRLGNMLGKSLAALDDFLGLLAILLEGRLQVLRIDLMHGCKRLRVCKLTGKRSILSYPMLNEVRPILLSRHKPFQEPASHVRKDRHHRIGEAWRHKGRE